MIHFTRRAGYWTRMLQEQLGRQGSGLRIAINGGGICAGFEYFIGFDDQLADDDIRAEVDGIPVYMDRATFEEIEGSTVDFVDSPQGSGFVVHLSQAKIDAHVCCCAKDKDLMAKRKALAEQAKAPLGGS
jgi:iron-sulfur cluster insertion protein